MKVNRKGGIMDLILAMIIVFVLAISLVLFLYAQNVTESKMLEVAPVIQGHMSSNVNVTEVVENTVGMTTDAYTSFKWISVLLIFGYFMSVVITSFLVRTHPAWFVGYIFVVVIATILAAYLSNAYETLMLNETLRSTFLTGFFAQNWIFLHFPIWVAVFGFIAGIVMYINLDAGGSYYR